MHPRQESENSKGSHFVITQMISRPLRHKMNILTRFRTWIWSRCVPLKELVLQSNVLGLQHNQQLWLLLICLVYDTQFLLKPGQLLLITYNKGHNDKNVKSIYMQSLMSWILKHPVEGPHSGEKKTSHCLWQKRENTVFANELLL